MLFTAVSSLRRVSPHLEPPRPSYVTHHHITLTHSTAGCFSSPLEPRVTRGTQWILVEVLSPLSHPCLPPGEPRLCGGWNPCMEPELPQKLLWEGPYISTRTWGTQWPWHWGLIRDCGATWALGAGAAPACWHCQGVGRSGVSAGGGPLLCVTLDFWPALPPPGLFPHLRGQQWLRSRGAVRGNENHVERPCGGTSLALGTPRTVPRKEGVTQSQGPLPPHVLSFSSWRQHWQHQGLWALLPRVGGQPGPDPLQHSACLSPLVPLK